MAGRSPEEKAKFLAEAAECLEIFGQESLTLEQTAALDGAYRGYVCEWLSPEEKALVDDLTGDVIEISGGGNPKTGRGRTRKPNMGRLLGSEVALKIVALLQKEAGKGEGWPINLGVQYHQAR